MSAVNMRERWRKKIGDAARKWAVAHGRRISFRSIYLSLINLIGSVSDIVNSVKTFRVKTATLLHFTFLPIRPSRWQNAKYALIFSPSLSIHLEPAREKRQ